MQRFGIFGTSLVATMVLVPVMSSSADFFSSTKSLEESGIQLTGEVANSVKNFEYTTGGFFSNDKIAFELNDGLCVKRVEFDPSLHVGERIFVKVSGGESEMQVSLLPVICQDGRRPRCLFGSREDLSSFINNLVPWLKNKGLPYMNHELDWLIELSANKRQNRELWHEYEEETGWDSSDGKFAVFKKPDALQNEARLLTSDSFMDKFEAKSVCISLVPFGIEAAVAGVGMVG